MSYFDYKKHKIYYTEHGNGTPTLLLHGNTASSEMFASIVPLLSEKYHVIAMDFLGCGRSEHVTEWSADLWYEWSKQVKALCDHKGFENINIIGSSGGALAAINAALEYPELINAVVADSFEGIRANAGITEQIRTGRELAKHNEGFCAMLKSIHGDDWERVFDADTDAVIRHAQNIGEFFHRPLSELQCRLLLTGSAEDEMFPHGHYETLFSDICGQTPLAQACIFDRGSHPAMLSNTAEFAELCVQFFSQNIQNYLYSELADCQRQPLQRRTFQNVL